MIRQPVQSLRNAILIFITNVLRRTMLTNGMTIATFTPLFGMSRTVKYFLGIEAKEG